jgi:hypothetical protein
MASFPPPERRHRVVTQPAEAALAKVFASDSGALGDLAELVPELDAHSAWIVVGALDASGRPEALGFLPGLLGRDPALDLRLVEALGERQASTPWLAKVDAEALFLELLAESRDPKLQRTLLVQLGRIQALGALSQLVQRLDSRDRQIARAARWSLEQMGGTKLPGTSGEWKAWLHLESRWWSREGSARLARLSEAEPAELVASLRELCSHPLYRDRTAQELVLLLEHSDPSLVVAVCGALERLGSTWAVPELVDALGARDERVRQAAWSALRSLTKRDLPLDRKLWLEIVEP